MTDRLVPVVVALALAVLASAGAPAPAAGAHPPVPLCGGCTGGFEQAATTHGANATVSHSNLDLQFHANGTATAEARLRVDERAANAFHENASLLQVVAQDAFATPESSERSRWADDAVIRDAERVDASIVDRTVTVRFAVRDVSRRGVDGVVFTDLFERNGTTGGIDLQVNRSTIRGPEGSRLVRAPDGWDGDALVLHGGAQSSYSTYGGYVAWHPGGGAVGVVAAAASIWSAEASTELPLVAASAWLAAVLAGALAALFVLAGPQLERSRAAAIATPKRLAAGYALAVVALLAGTVVGFFWARWDWLALAFLGATPGVTVAAGVTAVVAVANADLGDVLAWVPTSAIYALPVLAVLAVAAAVAAPATASLLVASASVLLLGALGVASARGRLPTVAVVVAFALAPLAFAFPTLEPSFVGTPSTVAWVLVVAALGLPLFALGRRDARPRRADDADTPEAPATTDAD